MWRVYIKDIVGRVDRDVGILNGRQLRDWDGDKVLEEAGAHRRFG